MLNVIRYILALPLSFAALWVCWYIMLFLWKVFHFLLQPLTIPFLKFEIFEEIGFFIDNASFLFLSIPVSAMILYSVLYYTLPKNKARKNIILVFFIFSTIIIGNNVIHPDNGWHFFSNLLFIIVSLCITGYFLECDNKIFGNHEVNEVIAEDAEN